MESAPHLDAGYLAARAYPDGRSREEGSLSVNDSVCAWERREPAVALCGLQVFRMIPRETPISFCTPNRIRTCDLSLRRRTLYPLSYWGLYGSQLYQPIGVTKHLGRCEMSWRLARTSSIGRLSSSQLSGCCLPSPPPGPKDPCPPATPSPWKADP